MAIRIPTIPDAPSKNPGSYRAKVGATLVDPDRRRAATEACSLLEDERFTGLVPGLQANLRRLLVQVFGDTTSESPRHVVSTRVDRPLPVFTDQNVQASRERSFPSAPTNNTFWRALCERPVNGPAAMGVTELRRRR
jgi:hypothetical protein